MTPATTVQDPRAPVTRRVRVSVRAKRRVKESDDIATGAGRPQECTGVHHVCVLDAVHVSGRMDVYGRASTCARDCARRALPATTSAPFNSA